MELVLLCLALTLWFHWLWQRRDLYKFSMEFKSLWGLPIVGVYLSILHINNFLPFLTKKLGQLKERSVCLWLSVTPVLLTVDPQVVKQILTQTEFLDKAQVFYTPVRDALKGGLLAISPDKWQHHRKIVASTFRHKQLLSFIPIFNKGSKKFLKLRKENNVTNPTRNILDDLRLCFFIVSKETTMGNHEEYESEALLKSMIDDVMFFIRYTSLELVMNSFRLRFLVKYNPKLTLIKRKLYAFANEIITYNMKNTPANGAAGPVELPSKSEDIKTKPEIFIEQAMKFYQNGELSWADIIGESNGILVASFETTASTMFSSLILLAMHPEYQERAYEEVKSIFPAKDFEVQYEDLRNLTYLEMVINEALRLFPPAPLLGRQVGDTTENLVVEGRNYVLPKNLQILISLYHLHRDPAEWGPQADEFNPDNFLPNKVAERHPYAFAPFSKGPRNCIGWTYAYMSMKIILAHILRNYKVTTDFKYEDIKINLSLFIEYRAQPVLKFHERKL